MIVKKIVYNPEIKFTLENNILKISFNEKNINFLLEQGVDINITDKDLEIISDSKIKKNSLYRRIQNVVSGIEKEWIKILNFIGTGYYAKVKDKILELELGYSHIITKGIPENIKIKNISDTVLEISSFDKQVLGTFCSELEHLRFPNPYTKKGINIKGKTYVTKTRKKKK